MSRCSRHQLLSITALVTVQVIGGSALPARRERPSRLAYFFSVVPSIISIQLVPSSDISQLKLIFFGVTRVIV